MTSGPENTNCLWCNAGNQAVPSSVSAQRVHTDTPAGRVICTRDGSRILLVDDDRDLRGIVAKMLRSRGHVVIEAEDGEKAIVQLQQQVVYVVVTDFQMPRADGVELAKYAVKRNIPVVLLTGSPDQVLVRMKKEKLLHANIKMLVKPALIADILNAMEQVMASRAREAGHGG